jgi:formylglycine-generating enzyme required for sulfatase activity
VNRFPANAWGLIDMHGNVWEWCEDRFGWYPKTEITDPQGPNGGDNRVLRGGSWYGGPEWCRAASRIWRAPASRQAYDGCRVILCPD